MLQTSEAEFLVSSTHPHHLWFEVLSGEDQGRRVSIPLRDAAYPKNTEHALQELSTRDVVRAVLVSDAEDAPKWRVKSITEIGHIPT